MILDFQNLLSNDQAPTTGTTVSTNTIDLGAARAVPAGFQARTPPAGDAGRSSSIEILVQVTTTFTGGTSLKAEIITSAAAALTSPTVIQSSDAVALATLVAGYKFRLSVPFGLTARYLGVQYVIVGTMTAGKIVAGLLLDVGNAHI